MGVPRHVPLLLASAVALATVACGDRDPSGLQVARARIDPVVFDDDFGADVYFQPFFGTHVNAATVDSVYAHNGYAPDGARSLKINVPPPGSALGVYAGGVLTCSASRDFADFDALTFYARSDVDLDLDVVGFGNDNTGSSIFDVSMGGLVVGPEWKRFVVPIPDPSRLIAERGLFLVAESAEQGNPAGYDIWFDDIRFEKVGGLTHFRSQLTSSRRYYFTGTSAPVGRMRSIFSLDGQYLLVDHGASYYDFEVTDAAVARVDRTGRIRVGSAGESSITAKLAGTDALGKIIVTAYDPPTSAAPTPTLPANQVISLFSDAYTDVPVDTWRADWGGVTTVLSEYSIAGNPVKMYTTLNWVGIDFRDPPVDASAMNYLHLDVFAPAGSNFEVKLVSFAEDLIDFSETAPMTFDAGSDPVFVTGQWMSLEIPLTNFVLPPLWEWSRIGHLVLASSDAKLVLVDNVYWHE